MTICGPTVYRRLASKEVKSGTHTQLLLKHPAVHALLFYSCIATKIIECTLCRLISYSCLLLAANKKLLICVYGKLA